MATTNKRFVAKNGLDNNGQTITNVGAVGTSLAMSGTGDVTIAVSGTATLTVPAGSDTLVTLTGSQTLTNKTISGSNNTLSNIGNGSLTNSSVSYNGVSVALGASGTLYTDDISEDASPTNKYFTDARARGAISVTDSGGDGSLSYDSGTGVITYTGPSASEVRAHFSAGTGVTISSGQVSIGQAVATTDNVTFAGVTADVVRLGVTAAGEIDTSSGNLTIDSTGGTTVMDDDVNVTGNLQIDGNLTVSGTTVTVNATNLNVEDNMIYLNSGSAVANPDLGFAGNYNDGTYRHAGLFRDASDGVFKFFHQYTPEPDASAYIDITHGTFALAPLQASSFTGTLVGAAPAGSLSGSTLASGVTASSLTSVGTLTSLTVSGASTLQGYAWMKDATEFGNRASVSSVSLYQTCNWATTSYIASRIKFDDSGYLRIGNSIAIPIANAPSTATYTDLVTIDSTGNVGIGTTSPTLTIDAARTNDVGFSGTGYRVARFHSTAAVNADQPGIILGYDSSGAGIIASDTQATGQPIAFWTYNGFSWGERVRIDKDGNVGIGATNPSVKLAVNGTTQVTLLRPYDATYKTTAFLDFYPGNDNVHLFHAGTSWGDPLIAVNGTTAGGILTGALANSLVIRGDGGGGINFFNGSNSSPAVVMIGGNVGMGTTSPAATLHIVSKPATSRNQLLLGQAPTTGTDYIGYVGFNVYYNTSGTLTHISNNDRGAFVIEHSAAAATSSTVKFKLLSPTLTDEGYITIYNGNVGIGTESPAAKLHVQGGNLTFGKPGNGNNVNGRWMSIEGNADTGGEGSSRIFFTEHNTTTTDMDDYGMSLGYRGGGTSITGASGNSWTGLSQINNGEWAMFGHDDNATGVVIMRGSRSASYMSIMTTNVGIGTSIPQYRLDVLGNSNAARFVGVSGSDTLVRIIAANYDTERRARLFIGENDTLGMTFEYDGIENIGYIGMNDGIDPTGAYSKRIQMYRTNTNVAFMAGNVGIGITNPTSKLYVNGTSAFTGTIDIGDANISWGYSGRGLLLSRAGLGPREAFIAQANAYIEIAGSSDWAGVTIAKGGGNVGIGTTNPSTALMVIPSSATADAISLKKAGTTAYHTLSAYHDGNGPSLSIGSNYTLTTGGGASRVDTNYSAWAIGMDDRTTPKFDIYYINTSGTFSTRFTIDASGHVLPGANGTQNLGSASLRWSTVYTSDLSLSNGIGDWTIVEGEDDLFIYNNKNNKVYKFTLQEVDPSTATPKKS